ncbi:hypothetical protein CVT25_004126 [Psilocybe cyanescens]|uniref:Cytochrome P450 n=1 Tax=Psilocybe cyanescens TaxID=93625 RepID=A0A409XKQ9_PSICY|nr:hypothetical protein CVT25_004126 [Psilocybe cyanescens]
MTISLGQYTHVFNDWRLVNVAFLASVAFVLYLSTSRWFFDQEKRPPGPPRYFFGSNKATSGLHPSKAFTLLQRKYGSVVSFYQGQTLVVVLGTLKVATELLEKRGSIYSSRPRSILASEILSGGMRGVGMPYGTRWRNWRSLMHAGMSIEASNGYKTLQSLESKILLGQLQTESDPRRYASHCRRFAISIVFCVAYGRRVQNLNDPAIISNLKTEECFTRTPGRYMVESWPILLYLPRFMQWFRHEAEERRKEDTKLYMSLVDEVRQRMALGIATPSTATRALEKQSEFGLNDVETAFALSAPFAAGVGTTLAALDVFLLAMLHYPDVMRKAQEEIDSVVGSSRLPNFDDMESLPYIKAVIKETLRWRAIAPIGVPHSVIEDDIYQTADNKMHIPTGSTVYANIYSMSKDEEAFPSPDEFLPERYIDVGKSASNSPHSTFFFGFGRRICPGMHVAQNSLYIVIARILWGFDILPTKNSNGEAVLPPADDFTGGLVVRPRPFLYTLKPRKGEEGHSIIGQEARRAEEDAFAFM